MHVVRTWRVEGEPEFSLLLPAPVGGVVMIPREVTISVEGLERPLYVDLAWDAVAGALVVVGMRGGYEGTRPLGLPARITRTVAPRQLVAEVLRRVARRGRSTGAEGRVVYLAGAFMETGVETGGGVVVPAYEDLGPIPVWVAEALARGRDKSQQSARLRRAQAKGIHAKVLAESESWPDIYSEVARRLGVGRTTAYTYLRDAGVIGKRGRK